MLLSVVGTDRLPDSGCLRAKLAQENLVKASKIPYTIVRSERHRPVQHRRPNGSPITGSSTAHRLG
jgi:hypothetical protein